MRDFMLGSGMLFDENAYEALRQQAVPGILPCTRVFWNDRIQLVYFTSELMSLSERIEGLSLAKAREVGCGIIGIIENAEKCPDICCENFVIDSESIYLDKEDHVYMTCLPAVLPDEIKNGQIYKRRVYSVIEELFQKKPDGRDVVRQIEFQQGKSFGNWSDLSDALKRTAPAESETLVLKGINTSVPVEFVIGHDAFTIGSDPDKVNGCIPSSVSVSPVHARIGWNEVNFFIQDLNSREGTFLNNVRLEPEVSVPFGKGSVIKFAECTFSVE